MIKVTKVSGETIYINENHVEWIEANPDTLIKIHDGTTLTVQESPETVLAMMKAWNRSGRKKRE